jgi:hypothetical protein
VILGAVVCMSGCGLKTPLEPVNRSPVVQSLIAFPTTIGPGDSAVVVCIATDADGDTLAFDWSSDCTLIWSGKFQYTSYSRENTLVVYPGACVGVPVDTGWVSCAVRDRKGGGAYAGNVHIIIRQ